jgi:hypothetical protein
MRFVTADDHVDIQAVEFDSTANTCGLVCRYSVEPEPRKGFSDVRLRLSLDLVPLLL